MKITRQIFVIASILASLIATAFLGSTHALAAQGSSNDATLQAFIDAYNKGDIATARGLVDPNFTYVHDPNNSGQQTLSLDEFFAPPFVHATPSNFHDIDANTLTVDILITGDNVPPLPHPWLDTDTIAFSNGRILKVMEMLSPQTLQDLSTLESSPGMPTTGGGMEQSLMAATLLLGLGLFSAGLGVSLRRAGARKA